jgi:hypothetical protein
MSNPRIHRRDNWAHSPPNPRARPIPTRPSAPPDGDAIRGRSQVSGKPDQAPHLAWNRRVFTDRQRHTPAIGTIALGRLSVVSSVLGIIAGEGPIAGIIELIGIALVIRGFTLRSRLKREEANPPRDQTPSPECRFGSGISPGSLFRSLLAGDQPQFLRPRRADCEQRL